MRSKILWAACACGIFALASCSSKKTGSGGGDSEPDDPNGYTLDIADPEIGTPVQGSMLIDINVTQSMSGKMSKSESKQMRDEFTFRETVLERPPGSKKPTRSTILIDKWESSQAAISDKGVRDRIVGKTIQAVKIGNEYQFTLPDGSPIDPSVKIYLNQMFTKLYESFNMNDFMPGKTVKRDDTWEIPIAKLSNVTSQAGMMKMNQSKSKGTAKLLGVSTRDSRKYGRIELKADIIPTEIMGMPIAEGSKIQISYILDACIDGTKHDVKVEGKLSSQMAFSIPGENVTVKIDMKGDIKVTEIEEGNGHPSRKKPAATRDPNTGGRADDPIKVETEERFEEKEFPDDQSPKAKRKPFVPSKSDFPDGSKREFPPPSIDREPPESRKPSEPAPKPPEAPKS